MSRPSSGAMAGIAAAALLADCATYLAFTALPLKMIHLGGGALLLGMLPAVSSVVLIAADLSFGRLADRWPRWLMVRGGALVMAAGALLLRAAPTIPMIFALIPVLSIGRGLFWPALQAELGARGGSSGLGRRIGWFNVAWSSGKMIGFWTAGHLVQAKGTAAPLLLAAALHLVVFVLAPRGRTEAVISDPGPEAPLPPNVVRRRFLMAAWTVNLIAYGVGAVLNFQMPQRFLSLGLREGDLGNFLGAVGLAQTLTFAVLGMRHGWEYRRAALTAPILVGMLSAGALAVARGRGVILLCAPGIGVAMGFAYCSSLYHSVHQQGTRGRNAGIHEALLGCGTLFLPLAGGGLVGIAGLGAPYIMCAAALAVGAVLSFIWLRSTPGKRSRRESG